MWHSPLLRTTWRSHCVLTSGRHLCLGGCLKAVGLTRRVTQASRLLSILLSLALAPTLRGGVSDTTLSRLRFHSTHEEPLICRDRKSHAMLVPSDGVGAGGMGGRCVSLSLSLHSTSNSAPVGQHLNVCHSTSCKASHFSSVPEATLCFKYVYRCI